MLLLLKRTGVSEGHQSVPELIQFGPRSLECCYAKGPEKRPHSGSSLIKVNFTILVPDQKVLFAYK